MPKAAAPAQNQPKKGLSAWIGTILSSASCAENGKQRPVSGSGPSPTSSGGPKMRKLENFIECHVCSMEFSLFVRKQHCANCGHVFCKTCTKPNP